MTITRTLLSASAAAALVLGLAACTNTDPTAAPGGENDSDTITIGTANFPESEIIGQIWAEALRDAGFDVEVTSGIGSREVYLSALENGEVDVVPEYSGNLSQFYNAEVEQGADSPTVYSAAEEVLPETLALAEFSPAESKDSFLVTPETAEEYNLSTLADLQNMDEIVLAGNPELAERPYGPQGLTEVYGVDAEKIRMNPISDGGGPLTVAALLSGEANVADIYTTSPHLDSDGNEVDLITLEDPENLILPQNVLPVYRADAIPQEALDVINDVNAELTTDDLTQMNLRNVGEEKAEPQVIARDYLDQ